MPTDVSSPTTAARLHRHRPGRIRLAALVVAGALAAAVGGATATSASTAPIDSTATATGDSTATAPGDVTPREGDFSDWKIVMILDGSIDDGGWNTTHARGGAKIE